MDKFREYIKQNYENVNENEAKEYYDILMNYIFADFKFIKSNKVEVFMEYFYCLILEKMGYFRHNSEKSSLFKNTYKKIRDRIKVSIDELKYREDKDFDYENEVLVIAFRILNYLELVDNRLCLKMDGAVQNQIRIYNDYRSNVYICEVQEKDINYASLKLIEEKVSDLRKEIEYLNDFILNYYQEYYLQIFRVSKIIFDKENIAKNFIQGEVKFRASFKIIQELIGPLYLNKESYGMRELIQNAVDACLNNKNGTIDISYYNEEKPYIIIKDNGIGMSEDIICNKFLTIGESTKKGDASIGKFGIGVLAAFLLADKMKFKTCHDNETFIYESEEIALEAVQKEEKFINIRKYKKDDDFQGTEIKLELKNSILENAKVRKIKDKIKNKSDIVIKNLFGITNTYGSLWYGYPNERKMMKGKISGIGKNIVNEELDVLEDYIKQLMEYKVSGLDDLDDIEKKAILENNIKDNCEKALIAINKQRHIIAYSIFEYLLANKWYLLCDDSIKINFYDKKTKLNHIKNFTQNDIVLKNLNGESEIKKIGKELFDCEIMYFWSNGYEGNVFCNSMLIPSKYKYESDLAKVFKMLPTIMVNESKTYKLDIDLARENCKLALNGSNIEEHILKEIFTECLSNLDIYSDFFKEISWMYFVDDEYDVKKIIKSFYSLESHKEKKYVVVFIEFQDDEKKKIEIVKYLKINMGKNIVVEFVYDSLQIDTTMKKITFNDLYIAACKNIDVIINKNDYYRIKKYNTKHLKALALAANNVLGGVDVYTNNQLQLNTDKLRNYINDEKYKEKIEDIYLETFYLNYGKRKFDYMFELPQNVAAMMVIDLKDENKDYNVFENIARVNPNKRGAVWNGFQDGVLSLNISENDAIWGMLMNIYNC